MTVAMEIVGPALSRKQRSMLNFAAKVALSSDLAQRHGSVITKNGKPISTGINKQKNVDINTPHGINAPDYFTVHAEADAISHYPNSLKGATLYVARINKNGEERYSRPCENCAKLIAKHGIRTVIYTITEDDDND